MNVLKNEFGRNIKQTCIWAVCIMAVAASFLSMAPIFIEQSETLKAYMEGMGDQVLKGMGIDLDTFFSPIGFFGYIGGYIMLALSIQAMIYGIRTLTLEKNKKILDFLYTKPVSRCNIYFQKVLANVLLLAITSSLVVLTIVMVTAQVNDMDYDKTTMLMLALTAVPIQALFYSFGLLVGSSVDKLKNITSVSLFVCIAMYFLNVMSAMFDNQVLKYVSFFNYYNLSEIATNKEYNSQSLIMTLVVLIVFFLSSYLIFKKRDFRAG